MTNTGITRPTLEINGHLAIITLNKAHKANSLDSNDLLELSRHIETINQQDDVLVLQVRSTGKYFAAAMIYVDLAKENILLKMLQTCWKTQGPSQSLSLTAVYMVGEPTLHCLVISELAIHP